MNNEFIVLQGSKLVVHSDRCKCSKRIRNSFCAYGATKEDVINDIKSLYESLSIKFAPCAENKLTK